MKNKKLAGIVGLTAVTLIGGSLAYFNQTMSVENPFSTDKFSSELVETFTPEDGKDWQPGATVNKDIEVANTGDYDVIVRVKFDETWTRGGNQYVDNQEMDVTLTGQTDKGDGKTDDDTSVVMKNLVDGWTNNWVYHNGYYYYKTNLAKKTSTGTFLDSVKLLDDTDMGKYVVKKYYQTAGSDEWKVCPDGVAFPEGAVKTKSETVLDDALAGYAGSDYKLTITAQTVQASSEAVKAVFGDSVISAVGSEWVLAE